MKIKKLITEYETQISVLSTIVIVSYFAARWIQNSYFLLEYLAVILIFGIIYEAWDSFQPDDSKREFIRAVGLESPTGMQVALLWFVGSTVFASIQLRALVEGAFGPLSVVQMLGVIVVLSRIYVNAYVREEIVGVFDGEPSTFTAYSSGIIAFFLSLQLRTYYPVTSFRHNLVVLCVSIVLPYLVFYETGVRHYLPDMRESPSE